MTASTADRITSLRASATTLRRLDEMFAGTRHGLHVRVLKQIADELEHGEEDGLGAARIREIHELVALGVGDGFVADADGRDARFSRTDDGHEDPRDYA